MRISAINATPVAVPFHDDERWAYGGRRGLVSVLLRVETDEGAIGIGEAPAYPSAGVVLAALRSIEPFVLGEDPFRIEHIIKRIDVAGTWHHVRATSPAIAGVEMACWDIVGKACGQPLVNLFGGRVRDDVEIICYLSLGAPAKMADAAQEGAAAGYRTFYLKVGSDDPSADISRVAAVREAVDDDARIRVDANESWSVAAALRVLDSLSPFDLEFAEQPVSGRNLPAMAALRARSPVPILANEASWTRYDQLDLIRHEAADAVSVDNQLDGGLLNMKRSAGLCEAAALPVVKHSLGELAVGAAAALHVIASSPNFLYASQSYGPLLSDDVAALTYAHGRIAVPDEPGIGVSLDEEKVARYAELYDKEGADFAFTAGTSATPTLPKR